MQALLTVVVVYAVTAVIYFGFARALVWAANKGCIKPVYDAHGNYLYIEIRGN